MKIKKPKKLVEKKVWLKDTLILLEKNFFFFLIVLNKFNY